MFDGRSYVGLSQMRNRFPLVVSFSLIIMFRPPVSYFTLAVTFYAFACWLVVFLLRDADYVRPAC